jgi:hypothetical protein
VAAARSDSLFPDFPLRPHKPSPFIHHQQSSILPDPLFSPSSSTLNTTTTFPRRPSQLLSPFSLLLAIVRPPFRPHSGRRVVRSFTEVPHIPFYTLASTPTPYVIYLHVLLILYIPSNALSTATLSFTLPLDDYF